MLATDFLGRHMVIWELLPQDLKLEMEQISCDEARKTARFLASVICKAHARQMDSAARAQWVPPWRRAERKTWTPHRGCGTALWN
jgi:hypothetical protein